jgi:hypothetical protein
MNMMPEFRGDQDGGWNTALEAVCGQINGPHKIFEESGGTTTAGGCIVRMVLIRVLTTMLTC